MMKLSNSNGFGKFHRNISTRMIWCILRFVVESQVGCFICSWPSLGVGPSFDMLLVSCQV